MVLIFKWICFTPKTHFIFFSPSYIVLCMVIHHCLGSQSQLFRVIFLQNLLNTRLDLLCPPCSAGACLYPSFLPVVSVYQFLCLWSNRVITLTLSIMLLSVQFSLKACFLYATPWFWRWRSSKSLSDSVALTSWPLTATERTYLITACYVVQVRSPSNAALGLGVILELWMSLPVGRFDCADIIS